MSIQITLEGEDALAFIDRKSTDPRVGLLELAKAFDGITPKNKIALIKAIRTLTGWDLKEAKEYAEMHFTRHPYKLENI